MKIAADEIRTIIKKTQNVLFCFCIFDLVKNEGCHGFLRSHFVILDERLCDSHLSSDIPNETNSFMASKIRCGVRSACLAYARVYSTVAMWQGDQNDPNRHLRIFLNREIFEIRERDILSRSDFLDSGSCRRLSGLKPAPRA